MLKLMLAVSVAAISSQAAAEICDGVWHDAARNRDVPVRVRLPDSGTALPVVIFSHGLGGSVVAGTGFAEAWARAGIATIHLQHPGSDGALLAGTVGDRDAMLAKLRPAMNGEQLMARVGDVSFALDELARRPREGKCDLTRLDRTRVGIAGHSFGAQTVLAVTGQRFGARGFADPRIKAAVALSPAARGPEASDKNAFGTIAIPFLSITGTRDTVSSLNDVTVADRIRPYRAMAPGDKYLAVFKDADHQIFGGAPLRRVADATDEHVRGAVAALTTQFFLAYLGPAAKTTELRPPPGAIGPGDSFERK